jgi:hypothetical protein
MKHLKLFEEFLNEATKPILAYDPIKDLPREGHLVFKDSKHMFEATYYWASFITELKKMGYVPYVNTIGYQGDEHKDSPYHRKLKIGPKQELDLFSALKASDDDAYRDFRFNSKYDKDKSITVIWTVIPERDYHGTKIPEKKWWRFEKNGGRDTEDLPEIEFTDYFKPKPGFAGLQASKDYGI